MTHLLCMIDSFFNALETLNQAIWGYAAFVLIIGFGIYLSIHSRFYQVRQFGAIWHSFWDFLWEKNRNKLGIHPLKAFFAQIGGCIGIGNVVAICTAVQIGGPGALFWTWVGGLFGMLIQYSEVYLGMKHRVKNSEGNYDGGPMYFLPVAFGKRWVGPIVAFLLCIYGVELFMFNVVADSLSVNWDIDERVIVLLLLVATIVVALGGIKRVGEVCSGILPIFIALYMIMGCWVLIQHAAMLPQVFVEIFRDAFTARAAEGGFAGSTVMLAISMGLSRGAYSGDIGVGYTSVIHAESRTTQFERQSSLTIIGVFLDTFVICTMSVLLILVTGIWKQESDVALLVQEALELHFPGMHLFMPFFLFLLGYTTILAYFVVGVKCAKFLSPKWGPPIYYLYACISLPLFAFVKAEQAFLIMSLSGAFLLLFNLSGMFLLRRKVHFGLDES